MKHTNTFILNLKMMQEASKRRCNKIKLLSLSFVSKLIKIDPKLHQRGPYQCRPELHIK